jgi:MoaA/NifB/PqqE/SkfB family radical SAM enzyme
LLSTGLLLKQNAQQIIDHIDEVIVSLDGSAEVHNEIRNVPNAYQKLMVGVQTLKELQPDFPVKGRSVLQKKNFRDFYGIINSAKEIGLDQISFLGADVSTEAFNRAQQWDATKVSSIALGDEEVAEFQTLLHKSFIDFKSDYDSKFIAESHTKMLTIAQHYGGLLGKVEFPNKRCNAPWVSAVIEADGDVRPCFFYPSYGNLNQHDFPTLLNSEPAIAFRKQLDIAKNPICQRCVCSLYVSPLKF